MNLFNAAIGLIVNLEGGLSLDPNDAGNYTPAGELKGTKFGISARAYPHLDIPNLTKDEAIAIYKRDYWDKVGAVQLPAQLAVLALDVAINSGVRTARNMLTQSNLNPLRFNSLRLAHYASIQAFEHFGRGWVNRWAAVTNFAASLEHGEVDRLMLVFNEDNEEIGRFAVPPNADIITRVTSDSRRIYTRFEVVP